MIPSRARSRLTAYLEDDLPPQERERVEAVLARSPELRRELADLAATVGLLRDMPQPDPPPFLAERVIARVRAGESAPVPWHRRLTGWLELRYAVPVAAAAVALAVMVESPVTSRPLAAAQSAAVVAEVAPAAARPGARSVEIADEMRRLRRENLLRRVRRDGMVGILRGAGHPHSAAFASHLEGADDVALASFERR